MELGKKLLQARQAAGLSQRQLCDGIVTRNMLSQIEHGTAHPSMETLQQFALRLQKPISWFLDEAVLASPNLGPLTKARQAWKAGDHTSVLLSLEEYTRPDPIFDEEEKLLRQLAFMGLAESALAQGKRPYALELLNLPVQPPSIYFTPELARRHALLMAQAAPGPDSLQELPDLDGELLLRAVLALQAGKYSRCAALLEAMEHPGSPRWNLLAGQAAMGLGNFREAAHRLHRAEEAFPQQAAQLLETCYRELEDYKMAYAYARKQK